MSSGVQVVDDVKTAYNDFKLNKSYPYIVFKISDDQKSIVIDKKGEEGETFDTFVEYLLDQSENHKKARYAVFDVPKPGEEAAKKGGDKKDKKGGDIIFLTWISDIKCTVKEKMIYASSKETLKKVLVGHKKDIQINESGDLNMENFRQQLQM